MLKPFLLAIATLFWGGSAIAQDAPLYDPNYIPWKPTLQTFDACGVKLAMDKRWPMKKTVEPDRWGNKATKYSFTLAAKSWDAVDTRPFAKVSLRPTVLFTVRCSKGVSNTIDKFDRFVKIYRKIVTKKASGPRVNPKKLRNTGAERAYSMVYYQKNRDTYRLTDWGEIVALHRGQVVTVTFQISRQAGGAFVQDLQKGKVISASLNNGQELTVKLDGPAKRSLLNGLVAYSRQQKENTALINTVFKSFQAY